MFTSFSVKFTAFSLRDITAYCADCLLFELFKWKNDSLIAPL